jgi:nitrite reductase (NO-forming)
VTRSTWHVRAGAVVAAWLVALVLVSLLALVRPVTPWLLVHLLLLGAASNAILIWSAHFAAALLRLPEPSTRRAEAARLAVFNIGALTVVLGMLTGFWAAVLAGGVLASCAVGWHAMVLLTRMRRALPSRFGVTVRYYVAAGALLPVGVTLGVLMARGELDEAVHARLALAHVTVNLLGWMGLTVIGTLVTLWPTMLHTQVANGAERAARRALPVLAAGILTVSAGALTGSRATATAGIVGYLAGLTIVGCSLLEETRRRPPTTYAARSVLAGCIWLVGSVTALGVIIVTATDWAQAAEAADRLAAPLLVGFAAQVLVGAMSYLIPVVLGGGPSATRATTAVLETAGTVRATVLNVGLLVGTLPQPQICRRLWALVVLSAMASFLVLVTRAVRLEHALRTVGATPPQAGTALR